MDCSPPGPSVHDSPGKNAGVGCHALLQGIFPTQGLSPRLALAGGFFSTSTIWEGMGEGLPKSPPKNNFLHPRKGLRHVKGLEMAASQDPTGTSPVTPGSEGLRAAGPHREAPLPAPKWGIPGPGAHSHATSWRVALDRHPPFSELCSLLCKTEHVTCLSGLPRWLGGQSICLQGRRCRFDPRVGKIPWKRAA